MKNSTGSSTVSTVNKLKASIDQAMEDYPPDVDKDGNVTRTYCNFSVRDVCKEFGYSGFENMTANQITRKLQSDPNFALVDPTTAQKLALDGQVVIAACLGEPNGHTAICYPDQRPMLASGKWGGEKCPWIGNVGRGNEDHKNAVVAANYAFRDKPKYYAFIQSGISDAG